MNLLPIIGIGAAALLLKGKKGDTFRPDVQPGEMPPPGIALLQIERKDINRILNTLKVDVILPDGERLDFKFKLKRGDQEFKIAGGRYWLFIDVMQSIWKGKPDPMGAVMVVLKDKNRRPIAAKRVLMNEKKIIDIQ
jgi:hypothetical protein